MSHLDTYFFFVNATATTEIYTLSLHDALPISVAYPLQSIALTFVFLPVLGLGGASFAVFTIWLPEQYPTRMRATAFALTTTFSRWVAAAGTFLIGYGIHATGSLALPLTLTAVVFAIGAACVRLAPETRDQALPT